MVLQEQRGRQMALMMVVDRPAHDKLISARADQKGT
jgi:hypothetical protein